MNLSLIDVVSVVTVFTCVYGAVRWLVSMRSWPLRWSVFIALMANLLFFVARWSGLFTPSDLNLYSAVRVLLTVLVVAAIPSSIKRDL